VPPRRIALATIEYPPDPLSAGIGAYTRTLARFLRDRGHEVHVVARAFAPASHDGSEDGVAVHRIGPVRPELPADFQGLGALAFALRAAADEGRYRTALARALVGLVEERGVELIEAADHLAEAAFYRPARRPRVPFVVRLHTPMAFGEAFAPVLPAYATWAVGAIERSFIRRATHVSAPSRAAATAIRTGLALGALPIAVQPNPVEIPPAAPDAERPSAAAPNVLYVGRIGRWKGVHHLVDAIPAVHARVPEARFEFVGSDHVGAEGFPTTRGWLLSRLPELHLDRVRFRGHVAPEELGAIYRDAAVCVFPSPFESFSYVCLEAMVQGRAIVGSPHGGMAELLDGGQAGMLVDPADTPSLADAITGLLLDPDRRDELGRRARRRAERVYGPERVMAQIEGFYERAIAEMR
jgi:glycogen synthase